MIFPILKYCCFFGFLFFFFCKPQNKEDKRFEPVDFDIKSDSIYRLAPNLNICEWLATASVLNKLQDTLWLVQSDSKDPAVLTSKVCYYIIRDNKVYFGCYEESDSYVRRAPFPPGHSIEFLVYFWFDVKYMIMDDLFLKISPKFSSSLSSCCDTTITHWEDTLRVSAQYRPEYKFHIDLKGNEINLIDFDIDSFIKTKKYLVERVYF